MKQKSFQRKDELIEAALDEFTSRTYENASLNKIIKNAGISKGTFYYHFKDKKELYLSLLMAAGETQVEFTNKRIRESAEKYKGKDIFQKFKMQFQISAEFAAQYPQYYQLITMVLKEEENEINTDLKNLFESSTEIWLDGMIKKATADGDFNFRFSNQFIKKVMSHLFFNYFEIFSEEEDFRMERMLYNVNNFSEFLKYGFGR